DSEWGDGPEGGAPGAGDVPAGAEHGGVDEAEDRGAELAEHEPRPLREQLPQRPADPDREDGEPVEHERPAWRVHESAVALRRAPQPSAVPGPEAATTEELDGTGGGDPRIRHSRDAGAGQPRPHAQVEPRI